MTTTHQLSLPAAARYALLAGALALAAVPRAAHADATANASGSINIGVQSPGGAFPASAVFTADPNFRRAHAMAYADHTDTTGSVLNQLTTPFSASASATEPSSAAVTGVTANVGSLSLGVGQALSFAHRAPESSARADGFAEVEILFSMIPGPGPAAPSYNVGFLANGFANLTGSCLPDEVFWASYQFYFEVYDFEGSGQPTLYSTSFFHQIDGPPSASFSSPISMSQTLALQPNHLYGIYAYFDAESFAAAPTPGAAVVGGLAMAWGARRRRR